jgi:penicillin-binding protein 1A
MIPWLRQHRATRAGGIDADGVDGREGDDGPRPAWYRRIPWWRIGAGFGAVLLLLLLAAIGWAAYKVPPWGPMEPPERSTYTFMSADGTPIARKGGSDAPVDASKMPLAVRGAFIAIEDRRFRQHHGVDLRGLLRASWHNFRAGGVVEGGSTISQQLAKNMFLTSDRKIGRKVEEAILAVWLDAWLGKDEILSRYLSTIYFGDGAYGLRAAARHYFQKTPETLSVAEAAMLAGMVKAPSRLAPTNDLPAAQARSKLVLAAMAEQGMIPPAALPTIRPAVPHLAPNELPGGTYFTDWVAPEAERIATGQTGQLYIHTTIDLGLQKAAIKAVTSILTRQGPGLHATQAALVAMRPDGRVVAMVGGRSYKDSPFNRVTQASRQPGSAFKLAVYLTAMEHGFTPDTPIANSPLTVEGWSPRNYGEHYGPPLALRNAFGQSSNVAAVRVAEKIGRANVAATARDLGISSPIAPGPSMALGTSGMNLLELTAAYAAVASGHYPVRPYGIREPGDIVGPGVYGRNFDPNVRAAMLDLLWTATNQGTGRAAALAIPTFGKTGTTQNHRDALFVGFAGGLVTGVWVGNDDNSPMRGVTGGTLPAQIWHAFMSQAGLHADDMPIPPALQASLTRRIEDMQAAAAARQAEQIEEMEAQQAADQPHGLFHFLDPLIPKFLRGHHDEPDDAWLQQRREDERAYQRRRARDPNYDRYPDDNRDNGYYDPRYDDRRDDPQRRDDGW